MSVNYRIDKASRFIDVYAQGVLTTAELIQMYEELLSDVAYVDQTPVLTDLTDVHTLDISVEGIAEVFGIAEKYELGRRKAKSAIVVNDQGQILFAKMSAALADQSKNLPTINVFGTRAEALEWLGVKEHGDTSAGA
jgi:hypothetical protein